MASEISVVRRLAKFFFKIGFVVTLLIGGVWWFVAQPTTRTNVPSEIKVSAERLEQHVRYLSETCHPRSYRDLDNLNKAATYIFDAFRKFDAKTHYQEYSVDGKIYKNVICQFGEEGGKKIIIGAHYDSFEKTPGADDNASGVAVLIELARLFSWNDLPLQIELVAYTLEEPPYFRSESMGSYHHSRSIDKDEVLGVVVLEMVGYYSDKEGSQDYPVPLMYMAYPSTGNFIGVVGKLDQTSYVQNFKAGMKGATDLPVYSINAPEALTGIDFSDHINYWSLGLNALMVTDTSFYRNKRYHKTSDTANTLNYEKMSKVAIAVFEAVKKMAAVVVDE